MEPARVFAIERSLAERAGVVVAVSELAISWSSSDSLSSSFTSTGDGEVCS